ncbi:hypothetical protein PHYPSEUDO_001923 [Phytophthora pseudosyringae]|uniref:Uncharacterized protein n=1 Tax=Phytophthora pseudosyringae TaxID=221518 RepID=A0A8T1VV23_9STRA|nr:hypothetical protein PHYPSEUDO_001923 [Phytophthora pseudosyringae]
MIHFEVEEKRPPEEGVPDEAPTIKKEGPLSTVKKEVVPEKSKEPLRSKPEPLPGQQAPLPRESTPLGTPPSPASRMEVDLVSEVESEECGDWMSVEQARVYVASREASIPSDRTSLARSVPSRQSSILFGTTAGGSDESNLSVASGSRSSARNSSSSSSMWSFGGAASSPMPYAGPTGMVFAAQGGAIQDAGSMGVQVTETTLPVPPVLVDQDDVVMSESGRTSTRSGRRSRPSRRHVRSRRSSPNGSPSDSSSDEGDRRSRRGSRRHSRSSKRLSKPKRSPSPSIKSERTGHSGRSGRSGMSGASQVALDTMRSTQDALSRMESKQDAADARQAQQDENLRRAFQAIQTLAAKAASQEERVIRSLNTRTSPKETVAGAPVQAPESRQHASPEDIEAACAEAARRAREEAQAEFEQHWQQLQAGVEADKLTWATDLQQSLNAQLGSFQQKVQYLEEARNRDQATIQNLRNVQGTRLRNVSATSPQVQGSQGSPDPNRATQPRLNPDRANLSRESSGVITGNASERRARSAVQMVSNLPAAQLQATLRDFTENNAEA